MPRKATKPKATKPKATKPKVVTTEICSSYSGKISTSKFENCAPFFSLKETWTGPLTDIDISVRQKQLSVLCEEKFQEVEKRELIAKIQEDRKDIRFYPIGNEMYPSVTSIINWDNDFEEKTKHITQEEMRQYAARGTIIHKQVSVFLDTGEWLDPKDIPELYLYRVILKKGSLGLSMDGYDFRGFYAKYPFKRIATEQIVVNKEYKYAGRYDIKGNMDGAITLMDVKSGSSINKTMAFKQLAAYAHCPGNEDVKQLMIIPLNNSTKQGFSTPAIETDVEKYWPAFKEDRKMFKERYSI
ncbi:MAG: hypothetical protein EOM59_10710 [Clostridia bacterium]|nr:hypothetical protein [Clostridia bacterium]